MKQLTVEILKKAFHALDRRLPESVELLAGGGGALLVAYHLIDATADFDAVPIRSKLTFEELKPYLIEVAEELDLPKDWINPYFQSFTHVLPEDYLERTREIFRGKKLRCIALGPEDLLIMKIFAARQKDESHILALIRMKGISLPLVEKHIEKLIEDRVPKAAEALDRFDEYRSDLHVS